MHIDILNQKIEEISCKKSTEKQNREIEENKKALEDKQRCNLYDEKFKVFIEFVDSIKDKSKDILEIFSLDRKKIDKYYIKTEFKGVEILAKPKAIKLLKNLKENNKIHIGIEFELFDNNKPIVKVTWSIEDYDLCSYYTIDSKSLDTDSFRIPKSIYFGFPSKRSVLVKSNRTNYFIDTYFYLIEVEIDQSNNKYIFKSIEDEIIYINNNKYYCANMNVLGNNSVLNVNISKEDFESNTKNIKADLMRIFIKETDKNEILKFEDKPKKTFTDRPYDINRNHWEKPFSSFGGNIITDYPRLIANDLQFSKDVKKFNKIEVNYII